VNKCMCGGVFHIDMGDSIWNDTYRWYVSYHCDKCGKNTEIDGYGIDSIPDNIKILIIRKEGEWGLRSTASKAKIKYLMGKSFQFKHKDFFEDIFFVGTQNQVRFVKNILIEKGIVEDDLIIEKLCRYNY